MTAIKSEGSFKPAPATQEEKDKISQILEIMYGACSEDKVLNFLRRNGGNVEKTITALFDAPSEDAPTTSGTTDYTELREAAAGVVTTQPQWEAQASSQTDTAPVIDLTGDDDEDLSRALQASLQDQGTTFGPSDRAPDPNWAVVPSNVAVGPTTNNFVSQDDQDLNQAIEASLNYEMNTDPIEDRPLEDRIRVGDSPVALCPTHASYIYAANLIHALYFVPQVREYIAPWRPRSDDPSIPAEPPTSGPGHTVWTLLETFVNMELSRMNELCPDDVFKDCNTVPWNNPSRTPGELTYEFYLHLAWQVEAVLHGDLATIYPEPPPWPRLFHLRHCKSDTPPYRGPFSREYDASAVRVTVRDDLEPTDLISCLADELVDDIKPNTTIVEASEVLAFELLREPKPIRDRQKFSYPASVYLDQFLRESAELATERRKIRKAALEEVEKLQTSKSALLKHKGRDTLADLRSAVYYFENIAEDNEDNDRRELLADAAAKLTKIIAKIEDEAKRIDGSIEALKLEASQALDCPELQKHKYDLRAVLVHDGLLGRNHLYSYVRHKGLWWKIVEYKVTEVSEDEVLNDPVGFHLGAGPYFLLYSRAISEERENAQYPWPPFLKDTVKQNNQMFFSQLPAEISSAIVDPNSPPTSFATPLEELPPSFPDLGVAPMDVDRHESSPYNEA